MFRLECIRIKGNKNTYFWWTLYDNSPLSECQCFGSLNHLGKSQRSAGPKRFSVIIREPYSEFSRPLQVASPDWANRYSTSFEPANEWVDKSVC